LSNWPDHTPEPGETPSWLSWITPAVIVVGIALLVSGATTSSQNAWRLPDFALPQFELPQVTMPDLDIFEREGLSENPQPLETSVSEGTSQALVPSPAGDNATVQSNVSFEACQATIDSSADVFGSAILVEDTQDRRVAVFKLASGDLTVICSRADQTMTMSQRN